MKKQAHQKNCILCQKEFRTHVRQARFCSDNCRSSYLLDGSIEPPRHLHLTHKLRMAIIARDGFRCTYCGVGSSDAELEVDHVFPAAEGGAEVAVNLVSSCRRCNTTKGVNSFEKEKILFIWDRAFSRSIKSDSFLSVYSEWIQSKRNLRG